MTESSELREAVGDLKGSIDQLRNDLVRKDVFIVELGRVSDRITNLERDQSALAGEVKADRQKAADNRRLIFTALALPIVVFLIQLYIQAQLGGHA